MQILSLILFVTGLLYLVFIGNLLRVALRIPTGKAVFDRKGSMNLSIVIPCRNEANTVPAMLDTLERQQFNGSFEVLIVDDGSTDGTGEAVRNFSTRSGLSIRMVQSHYNTSVKLTSKQQAVDLGIRSSRHEWVVLTDADMLFAPSWLQSFADSLHDDTDLLFGHTALFPDGSPFTFLQSWTLEFLFAIAAVFHHAGIPGSCMGNNLLIRKSAYITSGGYNAVGYSITEDRALLYHFIKLGHVISIVAPFHPYAGTIPHRRLSAYLDQIVRWFKGGMLYGTNLAAIALLFSLQNIAFLLIFFGKIDTAPSIIAVINFAATWIMTTHLFKKQHSPVSARYFPLFQIILTIGTFMMPVLAFSRRKLKWKDTTL